MNSLIEVFLDTLAREDMLPAPDSAVKTRVLCAFSGGADSAALLRLLWEQRERLGIDLTAAHVNHGLRGAESDADAAFCVAFCAALGIPLRVLHADVRERAAEWGVGIEAAARRCRYDALRRAAGEAGASRLAVAHNANDALETALFHLARGTGAAGLGIAPKRVLQGDILLIRPLIDAPRALIEEYLRAAGVQYRIDSSNFSQDYTRNRIRASVIPALEAALPGAVSRSAGALRRLRADDAFLQAQAALLREKAVPGGVDRPFVTLDAALLREAPAPVAARAVLGLAKDLVRRMDGREDAAPSAPQVEAVLALCAREVGTGAVSLPGGLEARRSGDTLTIALRDLKPPRLTPSILREGEILALPEAGIQISVKATKMTVQISDSFHNFHVDSSVNHGILFVRSRESGDFIRPAGSGMTKNLKKWLIERRLPRHLRELLPVFVCAPPADGAFPDSTAGFPCDTLPGQKIAAAGGLGVAEEFAARPGGEALEIRLEPLPGADAALAPLHALLFRGDKKP